MRKAYFLVGNFWLFLWIMVVLGGHIERSQPTRLAFFGIGKWFSPETYFLIELFCFALGVGFLYTAWKERNID